jgi:hypothetical protein
MPNDVETSIFNNTDASDHDVQNRGLRNRSGDTGDFGETKEAKVKETTVETPVSSANEVELDNGVEYVKGHPVIKTGERISGCERLPLARC